MAHAFNDDKTKFDLDSAFTEIENKISNVKISTETLTYSHIDTLDAKASKTITFTPTVPEGYIITSLMCFECSNINCGVTEYEITQDNEINVEVENKSSSSVSNTITVTVMCIKLDI